MPARPLIVFGRGRLGRSLAKALDARLLAGRQATPDQAPAGALVFLAVPDPAVPALAEKIAPAGAKLVHVSGALTLDALAPAERRGAFHPYQSFPAERPPGFALTVMLPLLVPEAGVTESQEPPLKVEEVTCQLRGFSPPFEILIACDGGEPLLATATKLMV